MPRDFASDLEVTDKATGKVSEHTIRVNHPLTLHGITVYQASFADGGSDLTFKSVESGRCRPHSGQTQSDFHARVSVGLGKASYKLEFDQFTR